MLSLKKICCVRLNTRKVIRTFLSLYIYYTLNFEIFQIFYLKNTPTPRPNLVSHNLSFCERQYCRRSCGRERQAQLTGDHWNKLVYCSDKNVAFTLRTWYQVAFYLTLYHHGHHIAPSAYSVACRMRALHCLFVGRV